MSVEIGWDNITSGPDGAALAEKIRAFVHDKFQQVQLPRFINAVHVHAFDLGTVCPEIEIKDICDPLPDFYEDEDDDDEELEEETVPEHDGQKLARDPLRDTNHESMHGDESRKSALPSQQSRSIPHLPNILTGSDFAQFGATGLAKEAFNPSARLHSGPFPRSTTPGIPGGTSNLSYFNFPGSGLSGTQTPLAAVASGTPFTPRPWSYDSSHQASFPQHTASQGVAPIRQWQHDPSGYHDPSTRPSTANSVSSPLESESGLSSSPPPHRASDDNMHESVLMQSRQPSDMQVVTRVRYAGDVRMTLTAEILLDYPMPSFVGIPLKLAITGLTFDGVAIVAWVQRKMHFCFLDPEDAATLVGESLTDDQLKQKRGKPGSATGMPGLLQEIHVESEIGRQADGKQVLKNVGKVEKFVLEQVRKIFEEEFVFPSYWTFLV
ncbi:Mitochondrial distribution and morphology protein 12 [Cladophialophora chaetospira]|uniref:Mitochondrial distribution and morphology protein 12 n=1 Tax=Cladophialophora chaetospira TaxID=386627 RepID=A0AA38XN01_9EURO|nr:Mitochondrial distribution and morphology protein 12 [Cladophialophora chaetospira]